MTVALSHDYYIIVTCLSHDLSGALLADIQAGKQLKKLVKAEDKVPLKPVSAKQDLLMSLVSLPFWSW